MSFLLGYAGVVAGSYVALSVICLVKNRIG